MVRQAPPFEKPDNTPEFYADAANVETQYYGTTLHFGEARPDAPQLVTVTIKMSPQLAKVLSLILSSHVRQYEQGIGPITVPKQLLHDLGLEDLI
jgi:hypothetical protein